MDPTYFAASSAFRAWLEKHHEAKSELLVGFYKRGSGRASITWPESVDEALCFGWIDGVRRRISDEAYSIRFTPRKPTSIWSAIAAFFEAQPPWYRRTATHWVVSAKREETRDRRLAQLIADSAAGRTIGPLTRPDGSTTKTPPKKVASRRAAPKKSARKS